MIKRIFITLCLLALAFTAVRADEPFIKISLGIRNNKFFTAEEITNVPYPLAFRIENTGKTVISGAQASDLFLKGYIHVLSKDRKQEDAGCSRFEFGEKFGFPEPDLQPRAIYESRVVCDLLTIFPLIKDGDYQVWWTLRGLKSNVLHFTVTDGKLQLIKPET